MNDKSMQHLRSGGRNLALYAELGTYFSPGGHLRESEFRAFIRQSLAERPVGSEAGDWLSAYLNQVLEYLEDKGMGRATLELFEVAIDESATVGVEEVAIRPQHMRRMLMHESTKGPGSFHAPRLPGDTKRDAILTAALEVFTERGFHEATMDEVASRSRVAKGTVYRYFKSKEDLLEQLLHSSSLKIGEQFADVFGGDQPVLEQLQVFVEEWVDFIEQNHSLYRLIQAEGIAPNAARPTVFYELLIKNFPMTKERVVSMNEEGALKTVDFHTVAYGLLGFVDGVVHKWVRSGMDYPLSDELPIILEVLFNGIVRGAEERTPYFSPPAEERDTIAPPLT